jgi:hypothetical protein
MRRAGGVLILAAMMAVAGGGLTAGAAAGTSTAAPPRGMAAYEWHNPGDLTPAETGRRLRFLRANGFSTVYLEIGAYLDAADRPPDAPNRQRDLDRIRGQIRRYVATATSLGLAVHALGGGPTWTGDLSYLGRLLVRLVGNYNTRVAPNERLQGVQLDIEPYVLWDEDDDLQDRFEEYLTTLAGIVEVYRSLCSQAANRGLRLGFAIPFWFDASGDAPGPVVFNDTRKPAASHIIDMVADLSGAYLAIMSYRNFTGTANGSIAHASAEFWYARKIGARCGLIVAQQYGPVSPAYITFHRQPRRVFKRAAAEITRAFQAYPQFRGISVDDVDWYMAARP